MASAGVIKEPGAWVTVAHQTAGGGSRSSSDWSVPARAAVGAPQSTGPQGRDPPHPATPASLLATTARQHHPKLLLNKHARCTLLGTLPRPAAGQHIPGREGPALPLTSPFSADSRTTCHGNTTFGYDSRLVGHSSHLAVATAGGELSHRQIAHSHILKPNPISDAAASGRSRGNLTL